MKVHEFQAKQILREYGVPTLEGRVTDNPKEAATIAAELGTDVVVVKAQIHAGGRGKGGGVKLARSPEEAAKVAEEILGMRLVTPQTGPEGKVVHKVLVEAGCEIGRELYVGLTLDRAASRVTFMASGEGGVEIEEVAAKSPEKILKQEVDPVLGLRDFQARALAFGLGLEGKTARRFVDFAKALYRAYMETDASLAEINPLVVTKAGELVALDAKMNFDDNGLYRHPEIAAFRDPTEEDPRETEAKKHGLSYIALDGDIGCMVNGAGLAMATMDIIKLHGGEPANFLDVGGGATTEKVEAAFKIILQDEKVKAVFVNIFGGIMKCDVIAEGVVAAAREIGLSHPLVVRLEGTNVEKGKEILANSGLSIITADSMADGAAKAVAAAKGELR
ncbi:MAG: ADP-forming succinate--CoA ligase subunit beta [Deltaproteobacteria bacterium]|nr:MAG: ADP-forming succinate--CoA ligase subunit beta [Deltaproteobacteria bacterium]